MPDLTVSFIQTELHWHDAAANRAAFELQLAQLAGPTDLIVLPEMFTTGFSMEAAAQAETMDGSTVAWLREQAAAHNAVLAGSVIIRENGHYYNRLLWVRPDGSLRSYDKRHLFTLAGEQHVYTPGRPGWWRSGAAGASARWCATTCAFPSGAATSPWRPTTWCCTWPTGPPSAARPG
ncbi:nitrilase-related carbon-nitrogen hydrolase [Hymenobacter lapidarius]|uniref:nitrilase-related carbon-nitrogen hydrolase n=1 Tax=Hymenobacter lapidarius TaxID=1908237 RepID=UPI002937223D|nr:nitrilase-related carbon-nitrogen hydrolase [Hymenobacter lapidarius]